MNIRTESSAHNLFSFFFKKIFFFFLNLGHFLSLCWIHYNIASVAFVLVWDTQDLRSPTRHWTHTPCIGGWRLKYWAARGVPAPSFLISSYSVLGCPYSSSLPQLQIIRFFPPYFLFITTFNLIWKVKHKGEDLKPGLGYRVRNINY